MNAIDDPSASSAVPVPPVSVTPPNPSAEPIPLTPPAAHVRPVFYPWYQVWWMVWAHPNAESFSKITADPRFLRSRAYWWIGLTAFTTGFISSIVSSLVTMPISTANIIFYLGLMLLVAFIPFVAVLGVSVAVAIYHGVARRFSGTGTSDQLLFSFAAIVAPQSLISSAISLISAIVYLGGILNWVSLLVSLYSFLLYVVAVQTAEKLSLGKAIATLLLPSLVIFGIFGCLFFFIALATRS
jgi:hypothetical protein